MRTNAILKKTWMDTEMINESEVLNALPSKQVAAPTSPITVASTFGLMEKIPEITPLPGAWIEVGKGGRPVKSKMYHDPPHKSAKKKRVRVKKYEETDPAVLALGEEPSSSKCMQIFEHASMARKKQVAKSKDIKYWMHYQQEKQFKVYARDLLVAEFADEGLLVEQSSIGPLEKIVAPEPLKRGHDHARKARVANLRRQTRRAAAGARCYTLEIEDEGMPADPSETDQTTSSAESKRGYPLKKVATRPRKASASAKRKQATKDEMLDATVKTEVETETNGWMPVFNGKRGRTKGCSMM